jgi:hypothetical protein
MRRCFISAYSSLNRIENSYGGGDGVQVTNTGTKTLWFKTGSIGYILYLDATRTLDTSTSVYKVMASDDYKPSSGDGPAPTQDEEKKMTTIAEINYPSNTSISITGGTALTGAKFDTRVKMIDEEKAASASDVSDSDDDD